MHVNIKLQIEENSRVAQLVMRERAGLVWGQRGQGRML